ncbi:MAG: hypothetical protein ACFE8L_03600 [Candidatus Hodarchaeota archaeon]
MGKGRIIAIIGAAVGITSVLLSLLLPHLFSWYHYDIDSPGGHFGMYLTAFGSVIDDMPYPVSLDMAMFVLIGGILVLAGAGLCIVGGATEMKVLGIIGGILMIVGPAMLVLDLVGQFSDFAEGIGDMADYYGGTVFFGGHSPAPGVGITWGLWIGYFMAIGGGILGLIGGTTI